MRIMMLGGTGAGKTAYLGGLYDTLIAGRMNGFKIDNSFDGVREALIASGELERLSFRANDWGFPPGTDETTIYRFNLSSGSDRVCTFEWIDYRGGALVEMRQSPPLKMVTDRPRLKSYLR